MSTRYPVTKVEKGKTKEMFAAIEYREDVSTLCLYDSESSKFSNNKFDIRTTFPAIPASPNSLSITTQDSTFVLVFLNQQTRNTFMKAISSSSLLYKDNIAMDNLEKQMGSGCPYSYSNLFL